MEEDFQSGGLLGSRPQLGGLLGFLRDPEALAGLAMIAKGLSPYSDIDPQQMLAQAHRIKTVQEERRIRELERKQQQDNWQRQFDRQADQFNRSHGLEQGRFNRMEEEDRRKRALEEAQRKANEALTSAMGGGPVSVPDTPSVSPYLSGGTSHSPLFTSPTPIASNPDVMMGGLTTPPPAPSPTPPSPDVSPAQRALMERARNLEAALRNPYASADTKRLAMAELERVRSRIGVPDNALDADTWRKEKTKEMFEQAIPGESAGRLALADVYLKRAPEIRKSIEGGEMTGPLDVTAGKLGVFSQGKMRRDMDSGIDALRRMLTGAGMPATEADEYVERYKPTYRDTADSMLHKHDRLVEELSQMKANIVRGRGPRTGEGAQPAPKTKEFNFVNGKLVPVE